MPVFLRIAKPMVLSLITLSAGVSCGDDGAPGGATAMGGADSGGWSGGGATAKGGADSNSSSGGGSSTSWELCEARGFKGSCLGTICKEFFGDADVAERQQSCEGIQWTWSTERCSLALEGGRCALERVAGCEVQSYHSAQTGKVLCDAYGGDYTPPPSP